MRYSLLAVAVSCTLMLTACNKSTDTAEPTADTSSSAVTTAETTSQTASFPRIHSSSCSSGEQK